MAIDTNQIPANIPLLRTRGDTVPFTFVLQDSLGAAIDITGRTFLLTVDTLEDPPDNSTSLFALAGVVDGPNGRITFTLSTAQADQAISEFFYDLQQTQGAAIKTLIKSTYTVAQDITK